MSVLAALVLWFQVTTVGTFTKTVSVPIRFAGPDKGLMIADEAPDRVLLLLRGTGRAFINYSFKKLANHNIPYALVNLSGLPVGKHRISIIPNRVFLGADGLFVESILENSEFPVALDLRIQRAVTVNVDSLPGLKVDKGVIVVGRPVTTPQYATIEGPADIVRAITSVPAASFSRKSISLSDTVIKAELVTDLNRFVSVNPAQVDLHFSVEARAEKVISGVPVRLKNFPGRRKYVSEPDSMTVTIQGPESIIRNVDRKDISVSVSYQSFLRQSEESGEKVRPEIRCPNGAAVITTFPETLRVAPR